MENLRIGDEIVYYIIRSKNEVLCVEVVSLASERSEADKPGKAHKTSFLLRITFYFFFKRS
jgi:hypothetical protein